MLHSYLKGSKLRAWLSRPDCPSAIQECKVLFDRAYYSRSCAPCLDVDNIDSLEDFKVPETWNATHVPQDLQKLIRRPKAVLRANIKSTGGVVYSRCSAHVGNSLVLFYPDGNRAFHAIPGCIRYIYEHEGSLRFAIQRQHVLPAAGMVDPYAAYPHFPARMYSSALEMDLESVKVSWVVSHYARWAISEDTVVVLSLCRVSGRLTGFFRV